MTRIPLAEAKPGNVVIWRDKYMPSMGLVCRVTAVRVFAAAISAPDGPQSEIAHDRVLAVYADAAAAKAAWERADAARETLKGEYDAALAEEVKWERRRAQLKQRMSLRWNAAIKGAALEEVGDGNA